MGKIIDVTPNEDRVAIVERRRSGLVETQSTELARNQTLSDLARILRARWRIGLSVFLFLLAAGIGVCVLITSYSATTILEINRDDPSDNQASNPNGAALNADEVTAEIQTDMSILQEDDGLVFAVVEKLNLLNDPKFRKAIDPSEKGQPLNLAPRTRDNVVKLFRKKLKVDNPTGSRLITITFKDRDPKVASDVANTLAKTFIDDTLSRRQRSIVTSNVWLQHELAQLKQQVQDSQQKLADYERETGLAGIQLTGASSGNGNTAISVSPQNTVTGRLLALGQETTTAEANRIAAEAIYKLLESKDADVVLGLGPMASSTGAGQAAITPESITLLTSLRQELADLNRQLKGLAVKYGENNPRRVEIQQQISSLQNEIQTELIKIRDRAANNYRYTQLNEDALKSKFKEQEVAANDMGDKTVKLQLLAQEAFSSQALYDNLYSTLQSATLASGTRATRIDIVAESAPPGFPTVPKWGPYLAALLALSLLGGMTICFVREALDDTIKGPGDLETMGCVALPCYIPRLPSQHSSKASTAGSQLIDAPRSAFSEAFRAFRTDILAQVAQTNSRTILVTSALRAAGKTTLTYNLGVAIAQTGASVLIIDADLRNPCMHKLFHVSRTPGLSEACVDGDAGSKVVPHPSIGSLSLLPAGKGPDLPAELLGSTAFDLRLSEASFNYKYVLIDSPPVLNVTDASVLASKVGTIISVVRSRKTRKAELAGLLQSVRKSTAPVLTFVLNDVRYPAIDGLYGRYYAYEES